MSLNTIYCLHLHHQNMGGGVGLHACHSSPQMLRQEHEELKTSLGYVARLCLKNQNHPNKNRWLGWLHSRLRY